MQIVHLHESNACGVVEPAHDRGVVDFLHEALTLSYATVW